MGDYLGNRLSPPPLPTTNTTSTTTTTTTTTPTPLLSLSLSLSLLLSPRLLVFILSAPLSYFTILRPSLVLYSLVLSLVPLPLYSSINVFFPVPPRLPFHLLLSYLNQ